jgi:hypothetical protein
VKGYVIKDVDECDYYDSECEDFTRAIHDSCIFRHKKIAEVTAFKLKQYRPWIADVNLNVVKVEYTLFKAREVK